MCKLSALAKAALTGQLSEQRLAEVSSQARTLAEAEAAIGGDATGDVRLIGVLKVSDARTMALRVLTGERAVELDAAGTWEPAAELLGEQLGARFEQTGDELRRAAFRQMALTELDGAAGGLSEALASAWSAVDEHQRRRTQELLVTWRADPRHCEGYGELARQVDDELRLATLLTWSDGLVDCVVTPALEQLALAEAVRRFGDGDAAAAGALAERRLRFSPWVQPQGPSDAEWATRARQWRAIEATSALVMAVAANGRPSGRRRPACWSGTPRWDGRSTVPTAGSRSHATSSRSIGSLESTLTTARATHEQWLDAVLLAYTSAVEQDGLDTGRLVRQDEIHARWVRDAPTPVAYVWVDALRLELGAELCDGLRADGHAAELHAAVAAAPTITSVGMANLTPAVAGGLSLELDDGSLAVRLGGVVVGTVPERVARLRAAHGEQVLDRTLDLLAGQGERELERQLTTTDLLLVRSQELDSAGEAGMLNVAWSQFNAVLELLRNLVARLGQAGVHRIVIAADHGFVTMSRGLGPDRAIDPPAGGSGSLNRRGWVGKGRLRRRARCACRWRRQDSRRTST